MCASQAVQRCCSLKSQTGTPCRLQELHVINLYLFIYTKLLDCVDIRRQTARLVQLVHRHMCALVQTYCCSCHGQVCGYSNTQHTRQRVPALKQIAAELAATGVRALESTGYWYTGSAAAANKLTGQVR